MVALILAVIAAVLFFLAAVGIGFGTVEITALGLMFLALAVAAMHLPVGRRV